MNEQNRLAVGIDLGTTFSAIACLNEKIGKAEIIPNKESERVTPSVVLFEEDSIIVGNIAKETAVAESERVVEFVKRQMGKSINQYCFEVKGKKYSAETISAFILKKLKNDAEANLGRKITDAVITVPAYFNDAERNATKNAGTIAGLNILRVINEPVAAALAYGLDKTGKNQTVFVFDLGGGTFDVTIIKIDGYQINMLATNGDHRLGGKDWDDALINYVSQEFQKEHGLDPLDDPQAYQDLQNRAVQAKIALSQRPKAKMFCTYSGKTSTVEITREKFEELTLHLVEKCRSLSEYVLQEVNMNWQEIDTILLAGGSTRMPMIKNMLEQLTGKKLCEDVNPDECVALGAAYQAGILMFEGKVTPNPAMNKLANIQINLINSHTLSTALWNSNTRSRYKYPMIKKMTRIPSQIIDYFYTIDDNQTAVLIEVFEGEAEALEDCTLLGECLLGGLPSRPKGQKIEVTFNYNENGMLEIHSKDVATDIKANAVIERKAGLTEEQVQQEMRLVQKINVE